ncbi:MAG TPA: hypothetical protein VKG92_07780, partial [Flavobacteriales bacterium]|nr:hypothetical protein [Flavobacteriales bacterium]
MGRRLLLALNILPLILCGQDYRPFTSGMKRAFADASGPGRMYSLALDSVVVAGSDTLLFNYFSLNDTVSEFPGCGYLGGSDCNRLNVPSWAGREILSMANGGARFRTLAGDTLNLLPPIATTDTSWFYSDGEQRFGLRLLTTDTSTFLGVLDSARLYHVVHVDALGQVINSAMNEAPVTIGKSLGLVEFFQVDSFPLVLRRMHMIGDAGHQIGLHCMTDASIHDYQVGDEIQYRHFEFSVFPTTTLGYDRKETIVSRSETDTSVTYSVQ